MKWFVILLLFYYGPSIFAMDASLDCIGPDIQAGFLEEPIGPDVKKAIDQGEQAFSVHLTKKLFEHFNSSEVEKNIFVSPSSIYQTLSLAYFGSRGTTESQLEEIMGLSGLNRSEIIKNYLFDRAFQALRARNPDLGYELKHANKFYFDRSLDLDHCIQMVLQEEMEALDFTNSEKSRNVINSWVKGKTSGKINNLLAPGSIDGTTKVALVNAAYFKGKWTSKFMANETKRDNFYVRRDRILLADFMTQKGKFNYYTSEELRAHVLELPYIGEHISMMIILPPFEENSLHETVDRLTPETLRGVMAEIQSGFYTMDDLTVKIPKFKIEQSLELGSTLSGLGARDLFDSSRSDLQGFLSPNSTDNINIQYAVHKSFIEVNEEGSEAAASTALFGFRSARPLFHKNFIANHPFIFFIYDKQTDIILFMGVFQNPKA